MCAGLERSVPGATVVAVNDIDTARGIGVAEHYHARFEADAKGLILPTMLMR